MMLCNVDSDILQLVRRQLLSVNMAEALPPRDVAAASTAG